MSNLNKRVTFSGFRTTLLESHSHNFAQFQDEYLSYIRRVKDRQAFHEVDYSPPSKNESIEGITMQTLYGPFLSASYLCLLFTNEHERTNDHMQRRQQHIGGVHLAADASFKITPHIQHDGLKLFGALETIMGGVKGKEIVACGLVSNKSSEAKEAMYLAVAKTYKLYNMPEAKSFTVDDPAAERSWWREHFHL